MRVLTVAVAVSLLGACPAFEPTPTGSPPRSSTTLICSRIRRRCASNRAIAITKTIDAAGTDWNGKSVASGPNPQTGPFYIEGAEPGDMLSSRSKVQTNRAMAYSSSLLAPYAVDPGDCDACRSRAAAGHVDDRQGARRRDARSGRRPAGRHRAAASADARLHRRGAGAQGGISTATPGAFGGNMDYAWMTAGVKLMLPVNEPGALLFLGDGQRGRAKAKWWARGSRRPWTSSSASSS